MPAGQITTEESTGGGCAVLMVSLFVFVLGALTGGALSTFTWKDAMHSMRVEALERGHAEWVVDSAGNTEFKWKE